MHGEEQQHIASVLTSAWSLAEQRAPHGGQLRTSLPLGDKPQVRASVSREGHRGLLLLPERRVAIAIEPSLDPGAGGVLAAQIAAFTGTDGISHQGVHIWCRDPGLNDAFTMFCALLCIRVRSDSISHGLAICAEEFRRLIGTASVLSDIVGLVGELLWLQRLIELNPSGAQAWMGPAKGRHDFRRGDVAVEVKASLRSSSQASKVHISAIDQLVAPTGGSLYLHVVRLERVAGGAVSASGLVAQIRTRLSGDDLDYFNRQIDGFRNVDTLPIATFAVMGEEAYEIRDGFPRVIPETLIGGVPVGVTRLAYDLSLDAASSFIVPCSRPVDALLGATAT